MTNLTSISSDTDLSYQLEGKGQVLVISRALFNKETQKYHDIRVERINDCDGFFKGELSQEELRQIQKTYQRVLTETNQSPDAVKMFVKKEETSFLMGSEGIGKRVDANFHNEIKEKILRIYSNAMEASSVDENASVSSMNLSEDGKANVEPSKSMFSRLRDRYNNYQESILQKKEALVAKSNRELISLTEDVGQIILVQDTYIDSMKRNNYDTSDVIEKALQDREIADQAYVPIYKNASKNERENFVIIRDKFRANRDLIAKLKKEKAPIEFVEDAFSVASVEGSEDGDLDIKTETQETASWSERLNPFHYFFGNGRAKPVVYIPDEEVVIDDSPEVLDEEDLVFSNLPPLPGINEYNLNSTPSQPGYNTAPVEERKERLVTHLDSSGPVPFSAFVDGNAEGKIAADQFVRMSNAFKQLVNCPDSRDPDVQYMRKLSQLWTEATYRYLLKNANLSKGKLRFAAEQCLTLSPLSKGVNLHALLYTLSQ